MGFFSWQKSDDGESVRNRYTDEGATPCKMIDNKGGCWIELNYEGYGEFAGRDYYALVDKMNGGDGNRDRGIDLCFDSTDPVILPKIVSVDCHSTWAELPDSKICPGQGYW